MSAITTVVEPQHETGSSGIPITVSRAFPVVRLESETDRATAGEFANLVRIVEED